MAKRAGKRKLEEDVSGLYSLSLEEFTAERDALAKRLRAGGDRDAAAEVKALKKPTLPAWAINQAVRSDPAASEGLVEAGERLNAAQTAAIEGEGAEDLREAMAAQQAAVEQMMGAVERALEDKARSAAIVDRARETLRALAGDDELRAEFAAGRVTRDREAVGFGGAPTPRVRRRASSRKPSASAASRRKAEQAESRAARSLDAAAKRVKEAQRRLERAERALQSAREDHDEAERERAARESELADARAVVEELRE